MLKQKKLSLVLITLFGVIAFSSCLKKQDSYVSSTIPKHSKIFIKMPRNTQVFENVAPIVYNALWDQFDRVGFEVVDTSQNCFSLQVDIKKIEPTYKFFSPDLLTYSFKLEMELQCTLFDSAKKMHAQKTFCFSTIIPNPKGSVLISAFLDFEYKRLLRIHVSKIYYHFRSLLQEKFVQ